MIKTIMEKLGPWGPVFFGVGFLAPLIAQTIEKLDRMPPLGLTPVEAGLICGTLLGLAAKLRGRWL